MAKKRKSFKIAHNSFKENKRIGGEKKEKMAKDIIDEELERLAEEAVETEERIKRKQYVNKQMKKEIIIHLEFSNLGDGELSLRFSPKEKPLRSKDEEISPKIDEWKVAFSIRKDPCRYFKKYEEALEHLEELYDKHRLEKRRTAYIDKRIARKENRKGYCQEKREKGIIFFGKGIAASSIVGVIVAVQWSVLAGIAVIVSCIVIAGACAWNWWIEDNTKKDIRFYEKEIQELKSEKHRIPAF